MVLLPRLLLPARVVDQPSRFTVCVEPTQGRSNLPVPAYLSNTGNLRQLLRPGAHVLITPARQAGRTLPFEIVLARQWGRWVAVDAMLSSRLLAEAIDAGTLAAFAGWRVERREPVLAGGRLDLLLRRGDRRLWLEAKCTTLLRNGVARFPLPATERGRRHLEHSGRPAWRQQCASSHSVGTRGRSVRWSMWILPLRARSRQRVPWASVATPIAAG
ncbi:MAG: DNA/RNA nuclease SfsA [Dehalococcoidia bacterium]|nr:DNA/RNA nuclease SfsA [Dehalococcoidia bacterium]